MYTDWLLVRRLAAEMEREVQSARIREGGLMPDGRFALRVRARGAGAEALVFDPFGETPAVTLEPAPELMPQPGWSRGIADAARGMRIQRVRGRRGDRLMALDLVTLSRFGVLSSCRLVVELVPRFGNLLLLKDDVIVAAAREFTAQQNPRRPIAVGAAYTPPPLPQPQSPLPDLADALRRLGADPTDAHRKAACSALRAHVPVLPQLVAASLVLRPASELPMAPEEQAAELVTRAHQVLAALDDDAAIDQPVYVWRADERIVQAHVVPLAQFHDLAREERQRLSEVFIEALHGQRAERDDHRADDERRQLLRRVERRRDVLSEHRRALEASLGEEPSPERLRHEGELLYAHHVDVPTGAAVFVTPGEQPITIRLDPELDAKANAAAIFKRYRKALGRQSHGTRRISEIDARIAELDELAWEVERADAATLHELREDVDRIDDRPQQRGTSAPQPRRKALEVPLSDDARVLVGRSPQNNADITFKLARPDDLWFHARGVPGAHVVLRIGSTRPPTPAELRTAAELAAYHSKARTSGTVPVDYTPRKYVRKRQNAMPGLVWYTHAKTIDVTPRPAQ